MSGLINYLVTSTVYFSAGYLFYLLLLSRDTHYSRNRYFLLFTALGSLVLPLITIDIGTGSALTPILTEMEQVIQLGEITVLPGSSGGSAMQPLSLLIFIYSLGLAGSLLILTVNLFKLRNLIRTGAVGDSRIIYTNSNGISGFSAMGFIFIGNNLSTEDKRRITEHERFHLEFNHFPDIIFSKIFSAIFWFNPFVYLYERSLKAVHEYQVDSKMLNDGEDLNGYQRLILNQLFRTNIFSPQSAFSGKTLIKKRIVMMTKKQSGKLAGLKLLLVIPVALPLFVIFACSAPAKGTETIPATIDEPKIEREVVLSEAPANQPATPIAMKQEVPKINPLQEVKTNETIIYKSEVIHPDTVKKSDDREEVFIVVEDMPTFQGGDVDKFRQWVASTVVYPAEAVKDSIIGKVYVMFVVNKDGTVSNAEILRGAHPLLDAEALRVVNMSPLWVPGKQRGQVVPVRFSITVNFASK